MDFDSSETSQGYESILTPMDQDLIQQQCELQHATSPEEIEGFTKAYARAKKFAADIIDWESLSSEDILELVSELSILTDKGKNQNGFRSVPVTFASGNSALNPEIIARAMQGWAEAYAENRGSPVQLYREFEEIHPYNDGNGRVGDLLWKIAMQRDTGTWPELLPPDVFGTERDIDVRYESAFDDLEE